VDRITFVLLSFEGPDRYSRAGGLGTTGRRNRRDARKGRLLFHVADAALANSGVEPFGMVGLETMAVGGVAFVGCTGQDYVTPGYDAVSLQSSDPMEIVHRLRSLLSEPETARQLRQAARASAARYAWPAVLDRA
jgi:glycosyltransferase involved in cell wall biosynthesis